METINEVICRKNANKQKTIANDSDKRLKKWKENFENIFRQSPNISEQKIITVVHETLSINTGSFTKEDLLKCNKSLKKRKAAGLDNITVDA